jgi:phage shock protein C
MESEMSRRTLTKSTYNKKIAGVCGGLAEYFDLDPTLVRVGYVVLSLFSAAFPGLIVYIILAVIMPDA